MFSYIGRLPHEDMEAPAFHLCRLDLAGDFYIIICFHTSMDVTSFACSSFGYLGC